MTLGVEALRVGRIKDAIGRGCRGIFGDSIIGGINRGASVDPAREVPVEAVIDGP
jgi:hypothetical protein